MTDLLKVSTVKECKQECESCKRHGESSKDESRGAEQALCTINCKVRNWRVKSMFRHDEPYWIDWRLTLSSDKVSSTSSVSHIKLLTITHHILTEDDLVRMKWNDLCLLDRSKTKIDHGWLMGRNTQSLIEAIMFQDVCVSFQYQYPKQIQRPIEQIRCPKYGPWIIILMLLCSEVSSWEIQILTVSYN